MTEYDDILRWMFAQLPMYQLQGASAYRKDLGNTHALADHLGHPEDGLVCIHVAGTNGKGSTSHLLASVLQQAGYKTGLYTSPHLKDFRERIRIDGEMIPEAEVVDFIQTHRTFFEAHDMSFFEMSVGLAFSYFRKEKTDIALIETGMGGRLDSTNIVTPLVAVITNIGKDHTQFLGDTLEKIASEKAGIIKPGIPVVIGEYTAETKPVFVTTASERKAPIFYASDALYPSYPSALEGYYQEANKRTVLKTLEVLTATTDFRVTETDIREGFLRAKENTGLRGRWEVLGQRPLVVADTGHNRHGLELVVRQLQDALEGRLHVVIGVVNDKDLGEILPLFPKAAQYYFTKPDIPRGLDATVLQKEASRYGLHGNVYPSVKDAYENAISEAASNDRVFVGGSTFVVAEIL